MSHPGNDFIIDMARDEIEDEPEISRGKVNIVFEDEPVEVNEEMEQLEKLFEEAVGGIIIFQKSIDDAICVLKRTLFWNVPAGFTSARSDLEALLERLENVRSMHTKLKEDENEIS